MKYIIIPAFKIIWSIILTIWFTKLVFLVTFIYTLDAIFLAIWELNFKKFNILKWNYSWKVTEEEKCYSVYHKNKSVNYKTPYHYIWGII